MSRWMAHIKAGSILWIVLLASGCANLPAPGTRLDADGLRNAIVADHVDYVRAAVEASYGQTYVNTPLMMAAMQGKTTAAVLLLRAGADPRIRVKNGHTAAELAAKYQGHNLLPLLRCAEAVGPGEPFIRRCENGAR